MRSTTVLHATANLPISSMGQMKRTKKPNVPKPNIGPVAKGLERCDRYQGYQSLPPISQPRPVLWAKKLVALLDNDTHAAEAEHQHFSQRAQHARPHPTKYIFLRNPLKETAT